MEQEQRAYSRVAAQLRAHGRRCDSPDGPPLFRTATRRDGSTLAARLSTTSMPEGLVDFLVEMDTKLDQILAGQRQDLIRQDFPLELDVREISGAGVRFRSEEPLADGQILEVVIVLTQFPLRLASAIGRVRGIEDGLHRFEFTHIREHDLESIVQFVFQEQREEIRNRKWS
ncbi:PilZ domain-containing protein [Desulfovibrio aminophilus]|nr:PilZ domain-containing protein [Desulfovibrio aminophilus]MCM0754460.1 PilZ domain-containing protein [Desulfovibrio aminophilus]